MASSTVAVTGPHPLATSDEAGVGGAPLEPTLGSAPDAPGPNDTGTNTSAVRSSERVWSALVATAQAMTRQSNPSASAAATVILTSNVPPGPNGVVSPLAYAGGSDVIQTVLPPDPVRSMPPAHGVGF